MIRNFGVGLVLLIASALLFPVNAHAANALGIDAVRLVDDNQDDGMFNLFFQHGLTRLSALHVGYSSGDDTSIIDVSWKRYLDRYYSGMFVQLGGGYYDGNDSEIGITVALGYERMINRSFVMNFAAKAVFVDVDEDIGLAYGDDPVFQPVVSFMFAF